MSEKRNCLLWTWCFILYKIVGTLILTKPGFFRIKVRIFENVKVWGLPSTQILRRSWSLKVSGSKTFKLNALVYSKSWHPGNPKPIDRIFEESVFLEKLHFGISKEKFECETLLQFHWAVLADPDTIGLMLMPIASKFRANLRHYRWSRVEISLKTVHQLKDIDISSLLHFVTALFFSLSWNFWGQSH